MDVAAVVVMVLVALLVTLAESKPRAVSVRNGQIITGTGIRGVVYQRPGQARRLARLRSKVRVAEMLYEIAADRDPESEESVNRCIALGQAMAALKGLV